MDGQHRLRNVVVAGRRTSVRLEPAFWHAMHDVARRQQKTVNQLATEIDRQRNSPSLTAAIRSYVVAFYRQAAAIGRAAE